MVWFLFSFLGVVCFPSSVSARILINEVYYDHPGVDTGYEFVELINTASSPEALVGYTLEFRDGNSDDWSVRWQGAAADVVAGGGLFTVGESLVDPRPDAVTSLRLQNGPDAVRLVRDGVVADVVGYGELQGGGTYEGHSAPDVDGGYSLSRMPDGRDTDDNAADFAETLPSPGSYNVPRHDVALAAAAGTPSREVVGMAGIVNLCIAVSNAGIEPIDAGRVGLTLEDSSGHGVSLLDSTRNAASIAAGDSIYVCFDAHVTPGYHFLAVTATYVADERHRNNHVALVRRVGSPGIIIGEIMSHPHEDCAEYIEITNIDPVSYDVAGFRLRDAAHRSSLVTDDERRLDAGGQLVLTEDAAGLARCFPNVSPNGVLEIDGAWPSLNHSGAGEVADSVVLLDRYELVIEAVAYPPQPSDSRGTSLERVDLYAGGGRSWVLSDAAGGGSPGRVHDRAIEAPPVHTGVSVEPATFDPYAGEQLFVTVPGESDAARVVVRVFDVSGWPRRLIGSTISLPHVFSWDGRDDDGVTVPPGIYIVACEVSDGMGLVKRVERVVVGCGRRAE